MNRRFSVFVGLGAALAVLPSPAVDIFKAQFAAENASSYENRTKAAPDGDAGFSVTSALETKKDTAWSVWSKRQAIPSGTEVFSVSFEISSDVDWNRISYSTSYGCAVDWFDAKGGKVGRFDFVPEFRAGGFKAFRFGGRVPSGARQASVRFGVDKPDLPPGTSVRVRDVQLTFLPSGTAVPTDLKPDLPRPPSVTRAFASPTTDANVAVRFVLTDPTGVDWSKVRVFERQGKNWTEIKYVREGDTLTVVRDRWSEGVHYLRIDCANLSGLEFSSYKPFLVGRRPDVPVMSLREDGTALVDGKPFFPIGLYGVAPRDFNAYDIDRGFADLKAAGFNLGHSYSVARDPAFLGAAAKYGFKLWTCAVDAPKLDTWFVEKGRHDPTHLAWYLGDDTWDNTTPEQLRDRYEAVTAIDGRRLTCQADPIRSDWAKDHYQDYVNYTDVFMPEIYPLHGDDKDAACVAQTIRDMDRAFADIAKYGDGRPRAVWPIIQHFRGWGWRKFPTAGQLNAMSFAALIHGGKGITWYTYGGYCNEEKKQFNYGVTSSAEVWGALTNVSRRISSVAPVLLEGPCAQPSVPEVVRGPKADALGQPSVTWLAKRHDGSLWLFAVNATDKDVTARLSPGVSGRGEVLWENRAVESRDGAFTDAFGPYGVHVYRMEEGK